MAFAPNALGQPTQAGTYATGVSYFPNGALKQFTYGNGIVHTLTQNARGLPAVSKDAYGSTAFLQDEYAYDQHGNVLAITDAATGRNQRGNRSLTYDALDRLTQAVSPMFGTASYSYDALDNLTRVQVGATAQYAARDHHYCYDAAMRLANVKTGSCSGATVMGLGYDVQGNLANRNGRAFGFDYGNRLRSVAASGGTAATTYYYDGHGRRVRDTTGASKDSLYDQAGQLLFVRDWRQASQTQYVYLGGSLAATRERADSGGAITVEYQHTDALGSPVAVTDASRNVLERSEHEPYGRVGNRSLRDGPGYTGHVEDAATALNYMQQRYYDPMLGVFLSVDPVTAYEQPIMNFCRYCYARNNPYKFVDPDGREVRLQWHEVRLGPIGTKNDHTLLTITPDNQRAYEGLKAFDNVNSSGQAYSALGAGPVSGNLVAEVNRSTDRAPHEGGIVIPVPAQYAGEDQFISALFTAMSAFIENTGATGGEINYDFMPRSGTDGYNSNSFISGLLQSVGADVSSLSNPVPGFDKPVPPEHFQKREVP